MSTLTLAQANRIIEVALAKAREMKVKPLSVAVLDAAGHVRSLQREDGASMFRNDVAVGKAWAAVGMGVASRTLLQRAKENPQFFGALSATAQGKFLPQTGAALIKEFGLYPPGCAVRLKSGEVGMVMRRGETASTPVVAVLIGLIAGAATWFAV